MTGFVDLHCHFVPGVDDGAKTVEDGQSLLRALRAAGFEHVVATPHMRPRMFDNDARALVEAFARFEGSVAGVTGLPTIALASEHYFDELVFRRLLSGEGLPYPGGRAVLLEFYDMDFIPAVAERLFDLRRKRLIPVIAHPERYRSLWKSHDRLADLVRSGAVALLDTAAVVGKYGKEPERCARRLLEDGLYHAACSDAHRDTDVEEVVAGIRHIRKKYGDEAVDDLFRRGPREILDGTAGA
jgi:protein-tyrosine phosphatase